MEVFVFKTSITYKKQIKELKNQLDDCGKWNFDLDDCDKILRVEGRKSIAIKIIEILQTKGYQCEELE
jgi:hypothetical protein